MSRTTHIYIDGTEYTGGIESGSMSLSEILCDSEITFGQFNANKFEVTLFNYSESAINKSIRVTCEEDGINYNIFSGIIESEEKDRSNFYRKLTCYDKSYFVQDTDVSSWWESFWNDKDESTIGEIRTSILDYVALSYETKTLFADDLVIKKYDSFTSAKFIDVFKMIMELTCTIPNMNRSGIVEFIDLTENDLPDLYLSYNSQELGYGENVLFYISQDSTTSKNVTDNYEADNSTFEDYSTYRIGAVQYLDSNGDVSQQYPQGTHNSTYGFSDNVFLMAFSSTELDAYLKAAYERVGNVISYVPAEIKLIISDLNLTLGTLVVTEMGNSYVHEIDLSGVQLYEETIESKGEKSLSKTTSSFDSTDFLGKRISSIQQAIEGISSTVGIATSNLNTFINNTYASDKESIYAAMSGLITEAEVTTLIKQTVNEILLQVNSKKTFSNSGDGTLQKYSTDAAPTEYTVSNETRTKTYLYQYPCYYYDTSGNLITWWSYDTVLASGLTVSTSLTVGHTTSMESHDNEVMFCSANGYYYQFRYNNGDPYWHRLTEAEYLALAENKSYLDLQTGAVELYAEVNNESSKIYVDRDEITFTVDGVETTVGDTDISDIGDGSITGAIEWAANATTSAATGFKSAAANDDGSYTVTFVDDSTITVRPFIGESYTLDSDGNLVISWGA